MKNLKSMKGDCPRGVPGLVGPPPTEAPSAPVRLIDGGGNVAYPLGRLQEYHRRSLWDT